MADVFVFVLQASRLPGTGHSSAGTVEQAGSNSLLCVVALLRESGP